MIGHINSKRFLQSQMATAAIVKNTLLVKPPLREMNYELITSNCNNLNFEGHLNVQG